MAKSVSVTAVISRQSQRPVIRLKDKDKKVRLRLRQSSFQVELNKLPESTRPLVELLIQSRTRTNGSIYETVVIWNKLRTHDRYWKSFDFASEAQFLAHYGLPDGLMLASWTVMINLFDRATFVLLGEDVLLYMMRWVTQFQSNASERRKDFENIFNRYCRQHDSFDKMSFFDTIRLYTAERYPSSDTAKPLLGTGRGRRGKSKKAYALAMRELFFQNEKCSLCSSHKTLIKQFVSYIQQLECIVREKLGEDMLPKKGDDLQELTKI